MTIGDFYIGDALRNLCTDAVALPKREAFFEAEAFVNNADTLRLVGIIYGMRSTGKTVILRQLAGRAAFLTESAYLTLNYGEYTVNDIYDWISNLQEMGIKYFYIDEVTWANGFSDRAMAFADKFASRKEVRIVLSGTDSLAFTFAKQNALHGRYREFKTTRMSFPEYNRLTGGDILDYTHNGGVFWGNKRPTLQEHKDYINASVVENIWRSVTNAGKMTMAGDDLRGITPKELFSICYAICESIIEIALRKRIAELWNSPFDTIVDKTAKLCSIHISEAEKSYMKRFAPAYHITSSEYDREKVDAAISFMETIGFLWRTESRTNISPKRRTVLKFSQLGVEREFVRNMLEAICKSDEFDAMRSQEIMQSIEEYTDGSLLESACLISFAKRLEALSVTGIDLSNYRIYTGEHEIDIVLFDIRSGVLHLYEVKRSTHGNANHAKNLLAPDFIRLLQDEYGAIAVKKAVLYRGGDSSRLHGDELPYLNIENFLIELEAGNIF